MSANTYQATVRVKSGAQAINQKITIEADSAEKARIMLEAQYGKGCVLDCNTKR